MSIALQGKTVLITGAAAGIGLGIARACADAGSSLIVSDVNIDRLVENTSRLVENPDRLTTVELDVSNSDQLAEFFDTLGDRVERLDGVVNNAGITAYGDFRDFSGEDLERLWTTNLRSVFLVCQYAARSMKGRGGSIVNIGSSHSVAGVPGYEMYAATKGGLVAMTRSMCWSLGRQGIRVNTLSPGLTRTEEVAGIAEARPDLAEKFSAMHPAGRYATVGEIGEIAVFLLSDASAAINGTEIIADHGQSALLVPSEDLT